MDWLFDYLSSGRLAAQYARQAQTQEAGAARVGIELEQAREELSALQGQSAEGVPSGQLVQILFGMTTAVEERIRVLQDERIALTGGEPEPLTHEQLVSSWPVLNNESRKALLRQVIDRIDLSPGRGGPAASLKQPLEPPRWSGSTNCSSALTALAAGVCQTPSVTHHVEHEM